MKKISFFLLVSIFSSLSAFSQTFRVDFPPGYNKIITQESLPGIDGSPFLQKDFSLGKIFLSENKVIDSIMLRYDIYHKEMQYQNEGKIYAIGAPENIKSISFDHRTFVYLTYLEKGVITKDFFEVLKLGKIASLYRHYIITLTPASYNPAMDVGNKNDEIKLNEEFCMIYKDKFITIDKKGKSVLAQFTDGDQQKVKKFIKEKGISFKDENDLVVLAEYINKNM